MGILGKVLFGVLCFPWVRLICRVRRIGARRVPARGGLLIAANHGTPSDPVLHFLAAPRRLRFLAGEKHSRNPGTGWLHRIFQSIPVRPEMTEDDRKNIVEALRRGDAVCVFPKAEPAPGGTIGPFAIDCASLAREGRCPVIPCYADRWREASFPRNDRQRQRRGPGMALGPARIAYGAPLEPEEATPEKIFEGILSASVEAFAARRCFEQNLETAVMAALKKGRRRSFTFEYGNEPRRWSRADFLGLAMAIARRWINFPPDSRQRIGILLPPGPAPSVINLGLFLGGKTPVNLPFNLRAVEVEKLALKMESLGIRTVITSKAFMPHLIDFWRGEEGRFIDLATELTGAGSFILAQERIFSRIEPAWLALWRLELRQRDKDREALGMIGDASQDALFLTSAQLHRNVMQVAAGDFFKTRETVICEAPMNTIVGQMLNLWAPLLHGGRAVCRSYSRRDDPQLLRALAEGQEATILAGDLAFFQDAEREQFHLPRLRCGMVFDETADPGKMEELEEDLDLPLVRGWHHSGRIVALGQPPERQGDATATGRAGPIPGTEGRLLPGIGVRRAGAELFLRFDPIGAESRSGPVRGQKTPPPAGPGQGNWISAGRVPWIDEEGFLHLRKS